jgi:hypothetical protein
MERHPTPSLSDVFPLKGDLRGESSPSNPFNTDPPSLAGEEAKAMDAAIMSPPCDAHPVDPELTFLILNGQKAGANSPSLADIITMTYQRIPYYFLFFTGTPLRPNSGALIHSLRNQGYSIHYLRPTPHPHRTFSQRPVFLPTSRTRGMDDGWPIN